MIGKFFEGNSRQVFWVRCGLIFFTVAVFWPVMNCNFVSYDDYTYVFNPKVKSGISFQNILWAFKTSTIVGSNWHPVTLISHMLDRSLFGLNAAWHHMMSLCIHLANVLLLFNVMQKMTRCYRQSFFVAVLFAIHPLHVESVAWIAERKDLLSAFFGFWAIFFYIDYQKSEKRLSYLAVIAFLGLSLLSKPMLVTLPCLLLLLDYWPLNRFPVNVEPYQRLIKFRQLIIEKVPLFAFSFFFSWMALKAQMQGGAVGSLAYFPFYERAGNALLAYSRYLYQLIWPSNMAVIYPYPATLPFWQVLGAILIFVAVTCIVVFYLKKAPYMLTGWLWYVGSLVPVIGLVQVGSQSHADRYTYIPSIGFFIIVVWGGSQLMGQKRFRLRIVLAIVSIYLCCLMVTANTQVRNWTDTETLFKHALAVTSDNYIAHGALAAEYTKLKQYDSAIYHNQQALRINPNHVQAFTNLGLIYSRQEQYEKALKYYLAALRADSKSAPPHNNIGILYYLKKDYAKAEYHFLLAIKQNHHFIDAYTNLGLVYAAQKEYGKAVQYYQQALKIDPKHFKTHCYIAQAFIQQGHFDQGIFHYHEALKINPEDAATFYNLGVAYEQQGLLNKALEAYYHAIRLNPDYISAYHNIGLLLMENGRIDAAVALFQTAVKLVPDNPASKEYLQKALEKQKAKKSQ